MPGVGHQHCLRSLRYFQLPASQLVVPRWVPRIVLPDNAGIHKGDAMEKQRRRWARKGLCLHYLPPFSPELNRIEILWKHAKYFWRRFASVNGAELLAEIQS